MKILLVDDSKLDRARVSECLEEAGFDFVTAENGADAWEILQAPAAPTFALLDWVMPGFDGIELCRWLRRSRACRQARQTSLRKPPNRHRFVGTA